jgi:hypothetical protein
MSITLALAATMCVSTQTPDFRSRLDTHPAQVTRS